MIHVAAASSTKSSLDKFCTAPNSTRKWVCLF